MKVNLIHQAIKKQIIVEQGKNLLSIIQESGFSLPTPCGGKGLCGKCRIKIIEGVLVPNSSDIKFLNNEQIQAGYRLACKHQVDEDLTIELLSYSNNYEICTIFDNIVETDTRINISVLDISKKVLSEYNSGISYIKENIYPYQGISYSGLKELGNIIDETLEHSLTTQVYTLDNEIIKISLNEEKIVGLAIDIGTTTIAFALVDLVSGQVIDSYSCINRQNQYGHDVISRIEYASVNEDNKKVISDAVKSSIEDGIEKLMINNNIRDISLVALSGNTTMIQLLLELSSKALSMTPFFMLTNDILNFKYNEIFNHLNIDCKVFIVPAISSFIGGDISSGILVTDMFKSSKVNLLIDIGTNGEMVIGSNQGLLCAATAAGPAFEGAKIKHGLGAIEGAISSYEKINGLISIKTIGNKDPIGICGTGIIDIVNQLLNDNIIDSTGRLLIPTTENGDEYLISNMKNHLITITKQDIREIQLAKSAIRSGIEVLMNRYGCSYEAIDKVYLAGGFGTKICLESAVGIGIIPEALKYKTQTIGNASLAGCIQLLVNKEVNKTFKQIIDMSEIVELSTDKMFNEFFMKFISFKN